MRWLVRTRVQVRKLWRRARKAALRMRVEFTHRELEDSSTAVIVEDREHEPTLPQFEPPQEIDTSFITAFAEERGTVLYGTLHLLEELAEAQGPETAFRACEEFRLAAEKLVTEFGGRFGRDVGEHFVAYWSGEEARSVQCAIELRKAFIRFNAARKVDGEREIALSMGLDVGNCYTDFRSSLGLISDTLKRARTLSELAPGAESDLAVSEEIFERIQNDYRGSRAGENRLSLLSGLRTWFKIEGPAIEASREIVVPPFVPRKVAEAVPREARWLVNNGSQMLGPLNAAEIAQRLFAQELDFDSECWDEVSGKHSTIGRAAIFSGDDESGAELWVFDGATIHGPLGEGFLKTALSRGAIPESAYYCTKSTLDGWQLLSGWKLFQKKAA